MCILNLLCLYSWLLVLSQWMKLSVLTIEMKVHVCMYFHVVLFIILYNVVLTFKSVDEILVCDHSNESY